MSVSEEAAGGNLSVHANTAKVLLEHDEAGGNLFVEGNTGGVEMIDNAARLNAQCRDNAPPPSGSGTAAHGHDIGCPV